tara:strand:- start:100 stop:528 length:429 start_codon:yes stop_codon:yes gene_type:complete
MPDYSQGKIYIITANGAEEGDVYVGSTTDKLYNRLAKHKHRQSCNVKILIDKYGKDNIYIKLIKDYPCKINQELLKEEGKYILETKCVNKAIAGRTKDEYRQSHKEEKKIQDRAWYDRNKEHKKKYDKERHARLKVNISKVV